MPRWTCPTKYLIRFNQTGVSNSQSRCTANISNADQTGNFIAQSRFVNLVGIRASNFSSGLRLKHQIDTLGRDLTIDLDYYRYGNYNDQNNLTFTFNPVSERPSVIAQNRVLDVYAFKTDYTHPLGNGRQLEIGMKTSYTNSDNSNFSQDINNQRTDLFMYKESVSALYLTYGHSGKKLSYQLGIRGEYTYGKGEQQFGTIPFTRSYFQPFPSMHFDYKLSKTIALAWRLTKG